MTFTRIASRLVSIRVEGFKCKQYIGMLTLLGGATLGNSDANFNRRGEEGVERIGEEGRNFLKQKKHNFSQSKF